MTHDIMNVIDEELIALKEALRKSQEDKKVLREAVEKISKVSKACEARGIAYTALEKVKE